MPWRHKFKSNEEYNAWYRKYRAKNADKLREYKRRYNCEWRKRNGYHNEENSKLKYPEREKARRLLRYAIKIGSIIKGKCEVCGAENTQGHHDDYLKPLDIRWLCSIDHTEHHKKISTGTKVTK